MIDKLNHYSMCGNPTIYDEEAMTALELAGRTAAKVNECVTQINKNTDDLPGMVASDVQRHINDGAFNAQIDAYAGELDDHINEVDQKFSTNLANEVNRLNSRVDNIVSNPGDGTIPTEVVDARMDGMGNAHPSLHAAMQEQSKQMTNVQNGFVYLGSNTCANIIVNNDGSVSVESKGRWTYRGSYGTITFNWNTMCVNIADHVETMYESDGVIYQVRINIPTYHTLVLNLKDKLLYLRNHAVCDAYDMVLVQNSYGNPIRGVIVDEWMYRNILANKKNAYTVRGAYLYGGDGFKMEFKVNHDTQTLDVTMHGRPTVCYGTDEPHYLATFKGDHIEHIVDNITYPTGTEYVATFKIPGWNSLVWNHIEKRWRLRYRGGLMEGDILVLATGYCQPLGGTLMDEWTTKKNIEFEKYIGTESMSYNPPEGVTEFSGLINGVDKAEKFMWFTDPHLCEGGGWQTEFETYKNQLKACFDATPTTFAICGGDWLGNGDTQIGACFKLGYIDGQMRSIFRDKFYHVVGNHDTNYQGIKSEGADPQTGRLDNKTIRNVWNTHGYYSFDGENTRFFVFDSELDWDLTLSEYKTEQLLWFCQQLKNNAAENMAVCIHIYFSEGSAGEMGAKITEIAKTYNNRGVVNLSGATFDYSGATGKVRFVLAGHSHCDAVNVENDIPVIRTTNTREGGTPSFDLCLVNYDTNKLHLCRVGSGESRTVDI